MVEVNDLDSPLLVEAVILWTGWGQEMMPRRDDAVLINQFGTETADKLLQIIKTLEDDFYSSDARFLAADLQEMERLSSEQFRERHPEIADEIVKAFAWCYTFDFK